MIAYNVLEDYQKIKEFESYLLIKQRIENECRNGIQETLTKLHSVYQSSGTENDLMEVLR
jgi:hypothetical protein